jgi:hypothetical protein
MRLRTVALSEVIRAGPEAREFVFTYRPSLDPLMESIRCVGILNPPLLLEAEGGRGHVIVCGSRRIEAAVRSGMKEITAFTLARGEAGSLECLRRSITDNRFYRGFNEVERAMLFRRLEEMPPEVYKGLEDVLSEEISPPRDPLVRSRYREILDLEPEIKDALAEGKITIGHAFLLVQAPRECRGVFFSWIICCGLNTSEARQVVSWAMETARRNAIEPGVYVRSKGFEEIVSEHASPRRRAHRLFSRVRRERFPTIEAWEEGLRRARKEAGIEPTVHVSHDPTFETPALSFTMRASSAGELERKIELVSGALREGRLERLFTCVTEGPHQSG